MNGSADTQGQRDDLERGVNAPKAVTLQDEIDNRKTWFYECQLRHLNIDSFRDLSEVLPDPRLDLVSEKMVSDGQPGQRPEVLGRAYLESHEPVWTPDERSRRDTFAAQLIGKVNNWLGYKPGAALADKLKEQREQHEKSETASQLDVNTAPIPFRRKAPREDEGSMGRAISRAVLAEKKPWLIPELYFSDAPNRGFETIDQWVGNLEIFVQQFETELLVSLGGQPGTPIPGESQVSDESGNYRNWVRLFLQASTTTSTANSLKATFLTRNKSADGNSYTYTYDIKIATPGSLMGAVDKFPLSDSVKYWTNVVKSALGECYVNKQNADMGLCSIIRTIYLLGTLPSTLGTDEDFKWRKQEEVPAEAFADFFDKRADDPTLKDNHELSTRLQTAKTKLKIILEESAANPHCASPTFSPLAQEIVRQGLHSFKFWLDEPFRLSSNDELAKARGDTKIETNGKHLKEEMEFWSENHYIMFASSEFLAGQLWELDTFQPGKEFLKADDRTGILDGKARKERGRARVLKWLNNRLMFGWTEFNSSGYYREHLWALLNLADFSVDPEVRDKATLAIDLLLFDVVRFHHKGGVGAAGGRSQFKSKSSGWDNALGDVVEILLGSRGVFSDADSQIGVSLATSRYKVPNVLLEIGLHPPETGFTDRSRVSITFEEAPKYGIGYSMKSDQKDSLMQGYEPKRARHFPFLDTVNKEIARTHNNYGPTQDDTVFWWGTSAFMNKQIVKETFRTVDAFGLGDTGVFKGFVIPMLKVWIPLLKKLAHGGIGGVLAGATGAIPVVAGAALGFFEDDIFDVSLVEQTSDDFSGLIEGSTRTRANILTFRNRDVMLSSIQNFRVGQLNFQSNVSQATLGTCLSVYTTSGFAGLDVSDLPFAVLGGIAGAFAAGPVGAVAGVIGGVALNEGVIEGENPFGDDEDGPGWWTGYWALPMVVQHDSAAILAYDFHADQEFLAETGSHAWFPKVGFDGVDEMRTSAYDDANFPLLDIGDIGPKGFWLFGKIDHPAEASHEEKGEGYIGVFSNQRPEWLDKEFVVYERNIEKASKTSIEEKQDAIDKLLNDLEDDDLLGDIGRDTIKSAVDQVINNTFKPNINRDVWLDLAKEELGRVTDILVQARVGKANELAELEIDLRNLQRIWPDPLPQDYFAGRDWYVEGKNVWIVQVGSREEFGDFQNFKDRVSSARIHLDDSGDMECSYDIPRAGGGSERLTLAYGDGGRFSLNGDTFQTDLYPRFENPFIRGGKVEWGQREYVIEYNGKSLLHDFSDFSHPLRPEKFTLNSEDRNTIKALVIFLKTEDEDMDAFTVAKADVGIGCDWVTRDQVIAAGPVDESTYHDAEWIFFDFPALRNEDMTVSLSHPASSKGDDTPHWKMSFSLRALMGDRTVRHCSLSYGYFDFEDEERTSTPFPFSVSLSEWRPWEQVQNNKRPTFWMIARRPDFTKYYYDYHDLLALDQRDRLWHRRLMSCETAETGWFPVTASGGAGPDLAARFSAAAVSVQPRSLFLLVQSQGKLFVSWPSQSGDWSVGWKTLDVSIYPDGFLGLPDTTAARVPIALATLSTVVGVPSSLSPDGAELFVLAADGNIYSHPDWRPTDTGPWRKIDVSGFSPFYGSEFVVAGDFLFVLGNDRALWAAMLDHTTLHRIPSWERVSTLGLAISHFTATCEKGICQIVVATTSGGVWATSYGDGNPPAWIELNLPSVTASTAPVSSTVASAGHAQFFALGTDGKIYTIGWESAVGWHPGLQWSAVEPGSQEFVTGVKGRMVAISRVNGQIELFAQGTDNELFKAWWS